MGPKKKQQEIDLSTLPECHSLNIFLSCRGKKQRAARILSKLDAKYSKMVFHVNRAAVLEYAKEKNIYIDPDTLTDKQKKDAKFMQSICTELTPQVLAKAVDAYINHQNVKIRLEKKANLDKPLPQGQKPKKIDVIYIFDDFPVNSGDFEALAHTKQAIKFVLAIDPKISWASAPEQPQAPEQGEQPELDEQYQNFKKLLESEKLTSDDHTHNGQIDAKIQAIQVARRQTPRQSPFRNTVVDYIRCSIDPYNEEATVEEAISSLLPRCEQLLAEEEEFASWGRERQVRELPKLEDGEHRQYSLGASKYSDHTLNILDSILNHFRVPDPKDNKPDEIDFSDFSFEPAFTQPQFVASKPASVQGQAYLDYNQRAQKSEQQFLQSLINNLKYPGIDRFSIPEQPPKSQGLRKLYRSAFGQFLPESMSFQEFQRKMSILFLESAAKEADEERTYDFSSRIYQQQHSRESIVRQLNRALLFDESNLTLKYNENNDKLYVCLLYKNPPRRMQRKNWEAPWKVLPNFENWLKYFKDNESNLNNNQYYGIDYELIGHIQEDANVYSVKDGGVIVRTSATIAGRQNRVLYCVAGDNTGELVFGLRDKAQNTEFYAQNEACKLTVASTDHSTTRSIFLSFKDGTIAEFKQNGDVLLRAPSCPPRLINRHGYTVIYATGAAVSILHPTGGISHPPSQYVNQNGRGLHQGKLHEVPTLRKTTQPNELVTRRDDKTVIIDRNGSKWIQFPDQTEYLKEGEGLVIEKAGLPRVQVLGNGSLRLTYSGVEVISHQFNQQFEFNFTFARLSNNNGSSFRVMGSTVEVYDGRTETPYLCSLAQPASISKSWGDEQLTVSYQGSSYRRSSGKAVDPEQDQQAYNQQDTLRPDYIEPRLFIINNDNTAVELLSSQQLEPAYLTTFQNVGPGDQIVRPEIRVVNNGPQSQAVYGIVPLPTQGGLNAKFISPPQINTDIFNNVAKPSIQAQQAPALQVRCVIRHGAFTQEDRQTISKIIQKRKQWQAKAERDDNQFGFKPRDDPSTADRFESKKKVIELRKTKEQEIQCDRLKDEARSLYEQQTNARYDKAEKLARQTELRKQLSRKKSYVSQYKWKPPKFSKKDQSKDSYNYAEQFYPNYFDTIEGRKALSEMPEWVFRPKEIKKQQQIDPEIREELNATLNRTKKSEDAVNLSQQNNSIQNANQKPERYNTVQPELMPAAQVYIKPSVFTKRQIDEQRSAFESQKKAYEYHQRKRKQYNVYGSERNQKVQVPSLMRTQPMSELNQKYLVTEAPVDKKVRISSMKNKLTSEASNMTEMRKEGPHANLIKTIDKGNDYSKLLERRTMMVQADLNDKLQRDIQINPIEANFGTVREGGNYQLKIEIKNEDVLAQRVHLKKPKSIFCKVQMSEMGPIALGMTRKISVMLKAAPEIIGKFTDQFDIVTKHQIYHIPISAVILSRNQFEMTGSMLLKTVKQFQEIGKKKREELPPIKSP